jgi:hypothetical protein
MRFFAVDRKLTEREKAGIKGKINEVEIPNLGMYVLVEDDTAELPALLSPNRILNIPGEVHRCTNCGEPI